jgi:hypothetical protein
MERELRLRLRAASYGGTLPLVNGDPFEALAGALRANAASLAEDSATRFGFASGGERVFAHAEIEREEFLRLCALIAPRGRAAL